MKKNKNVYAVSVGEVFILLAWSKSKSVADEYAKNYAKVEGLEGDIYVTKMPFSQVRESLSEQCNVYEYELVYMGHGLYVPDKYRAFYHETAETLRESENEVMKVLSFIEPSSSLKTRAAISITRKAVRRYFKKERKKLVDKNLCEEWLSLNSRFSDLIR